MAKEKKKTVVKAKVTPQKAISVGQWQTLRKWNIWLAVVFAAQAVAIVVAGTAKTVPLTREYLAIDPLATEATGKQVVATASREVWDVRIACLVAAFLLIFAAAYLVVATWQRKRYEARLKLGMNDARWLGLGLGGGMALVTIAMLSGITNKASLLMIFMLMALGCLAVLCAEEVARREAGKGLLSHVICAVGTLAVLTPLVVLALTVGAAWMYNGHTSAYMYGVYVSLLVFFIVGLLMTHSRIKQKGKWADTIFTEKAYMLLTVVGASILAWEIFVGVLQP
jgi:hypothetical protein